MLSIRQLYIALSLAYIVLLFLGMVLIRGLWFYPEEKDKALQLQQNEVDGLLSALTLRRQQLISTVHDYASWDDSFSFTQNRDPDYLSSNFVPSTYESLALSAVLIVNNKEQILYAGQYDNGVLNQTPDDLLQWTNTIGSEFFSHHVSSDLQQISGTSYVIAASPVTPTGSGDPIGGWMLFMQRIDAQYLAVLADVSRLHITLLPTHAGAENLTTPLQKLQAIRPACLYDQKGNASLCVRIEHSNGTGPSMLNAGVIATFLIMCLIPTLVFMWLLRLVIEPIRRATEILERSNADRMIRPVLSSTPIRIRELQQLRDAYNELVHTTRQQQARLEQLSNTDRLTNLPNRRAFDDALERTWRRILRHPQSIALVLVDIDYFKRYNDSYGHQAGDIALHQVAQALKSCAKRTDELASRFGGEEFALILQVEDATRLESLRQRLSESIRNLDIHHDHSPLSHQLTISFGIAWIRESGPWLEKMGKEEWLRAADSALYEAKASGRNCNMLQVISPDMPFTESPVLQQSPD